MGDVLEFTPKVPDDETLTLVDNVDVAFCLWAVNMFGVQHRPDIATPVEVILIGPEDLSTLRNEFIRECLTQAKDSDLLTDEGKSFIARLLANTTTQA